MELFLHENGKNVGPYTEEQIASMISSGQLTGDDMVWHKGLSEWQPLRTFTSQSMSAPPPPKPQQVPSEVKTNVKQGALIGAFVCFAVGVLLMFFTLWSFIIYSPLFLAAFILSIAAMAQKRVGGGLIALLLTLIVPPIIFFSLTALRGGKAVEKISESMEQAGEEIANAWEKAELESVASQIKDLTKRKTVSADTQSILKRIIVTNPRFYWSNSEFMSEPVIDLKVRNRTGQALARLFFRGTLTSPGRTIPWVDKDFNYTVQGGVENGEEKHLRLSPNSFGPWGNRELKSRSDLRFKVTVINATDASGEKLVEEFGKHEEDRLQELLEKQMELESRMEK